MWSAISSYLNDAPNPSTALPPSTPRRNTPPSTPRRLTALMSSSERRIRNNAAVLSPGNNNNSTIGSSSSSQVKEQKVAILRGIIVGSHQSGKTSLLRRLRDEEITNNAETRKLMALVPWKVPDNIGSVKDDEVVQLYVSEGASFTSYDAESKDARGLVEKEWKEILGRQVKKHLDFMVWMVDTRQESEH
eukprot:scaffold148607_cov36-Cyclotella_meneghiniana.AAC.1